ncbi:DUF5996 family protein [Vulgatibacter incomptus]|uniref:Uncharacterized protein n=1 Tax=Vulgatibacter incomptus TaxID=1391653 RepID=A0A0K1PCU6_9BACT|nr:DUF5996 family protein [Vulgatibacter incomptus]AKU91345.1 hypothetical protein AKJ08_1732 [Vulgatibacter incomptus]
MSEGWPELPYESWKDTHDTLLRYSQIVGKIQLALTPLVNHWWNVAFRLDTRGMHTLPMRCDGGSFEIAFDFVDHALVVRTSRGVVRSLPLVARSVADFWSELFTVLESLGIEVELSDRPCELALEKNGLPFREDRIHASYDPHAAYSWWQILLSTERVLEEFRSRFQGKCSPVLFWWGTFDLAVTRFSGKRAPPMPDADVITRESFTHEESSAGIWPGNASLGEPAFYSYAMPAPAGFGEAPVLPKEAYFDHDLGEFVLPYSAVRTSRNPRETLLAFLQSTYEAAADLGGWDRKRLERAPPEPLIAEPGGAPLH